MQIVSLAERRAERAARAVHDGSRPIYVNAALYRRTVAAIMNAGTDDHVKIALGELLNVWPDSIAE